MEKEPSHPQDEAVDGSQKQPAVFTIRTSNKYFYLAYIVVAMLAMILLKPEYPAALGRLVGQAIGALIITTFIAYACWLFSFRRHWVGEWAFNLVLVVLMVKLSLSYLNIQQARSSYAQLKQAENNFIEVLQSEDASQQAIDEAYDEVSEQAFANLEQHARMTSGSEQKAIRITQQYMRELVTVIDDWEIKFDVFDQTDVLDYTMLKIDPYVYENRTRVLVELREATELYAKWMRDMKPDLQLRLQDAGLTAKKRDQLVDQLLSSPHFELAEVLKLLDLMIRYTDELSGALDLLHHNEPLWEVDGVELIIEDDAFRGQYNDLLDVLIKTEESMEQQFNRVYRNQELTGG